MKAQSNTALGRWGEEVAAQALAARGYAILERNWRCAEGEVDIVARDDNVLVFAEVKTRRGNAHGTPDEAVGPVKQTRLLRVAKHYLFEHDLAEVAWRIDVVAITLVRGREVRTIEVFKDAVYDFG